MKIGNFEPDKQITVKLGILQKLDVFDKSWMLRLSPTFTPYYQSKAAVGGNKVARFLSAKNLPYQWEVDA